MITKNYTYQYKLIKIIPQTKLQDLLFDLIKIRKH